MKKSFSSYVATAIAIGTLALTGCAADATGSEDKIPSNEDWGDETKYPEIGGAFSTLTAVDYATLTVGAAGTADAGKMTIVLNDTAQTVVISVRAVDSQILLNGQVPAAIKGVTTKTLKKIALTVDANAAVNVQNVVLDFLSGTFAPGTKLTGTAATPGISIHLGGTAGDTVAVRGSTKGDLIAVGAGSAGLSGSRPLVSFTADAFPDVILASDVDLTFSLAAGADTFSADPVALQNLGGAYTAKVTVFGGADADKVTGGAGNDVLRGGDGNDTVAGGLGNDVMYGDAGDDVFTAAAVTDGSDVFDCGASTVNIGDKVSYELRAADKHVRVSLETLAHLGADGLVGTADDIANLGADNAPGGAGGDADTLLTRNDGELGAAADGSDGEQDQVLTGCEHVTGGKGNDRLYGDAAKNTLTGGDGDDLLQGGAETDTHKGGAGSDTVDYSEHAAGVTVTLATGNTPSAVSGTGSENDIIEGDIENVIGSGFDDTITGNALANELTGMAGDDTLNGGDGDDIFHEDPLVGPDGVVGGGDDVEDTGGDEFNGGLGADTVDYSKRTTGVKVTAAGTAVVAATSGDDGASTWGAPQDATTVLAPQTITNVEDDNVWANVENILGGAGADYLVGDKTASNTTVNVIDGGDGIDYIDGGEGDDTLSGGDDVDYVLGGLGDDTIEGGAGADVFDCGLGDDLAFDGAEVDPLVVTCELLF